MQRYKDLLRRVINRARVSPNPLMRGSIDLAQHAFRTLGWLIPGLGLGWVSALRSARWDGDDLVLNGWGYVRGATYGAHPRFEVFLGRRHVPTWLGGRVARAEVRPVEDRDVLGMALQAERDYRDATWEARFPASELARLKPGRWQLRAKTRGGGRVSGGRVKLVYFFGTPAVLPASETSGKLLALESHQLPAGGADVVVRPSGPRVVDARVTGRRVSLRIESAGSITDAVLQGRGQPDVPLTLSETADGVVVSGEVPEGKAVVDRQTKVRFPPRWELVIDGQRAAFAWAEPARPAAHGEPVIRAAQDGSLEIVDVPYFVELTSMAREGNRLRLTGWMAGSAEGFRLVLAAPRAEIPVTVDSVRSDGSFTASAPLRVSAWGGPTLPPMRGAYVLEGRRDDRTGNAGRFATFVSEHYIANVPVVDSGDDVQLRFELNQQPQALVKVNRPRRPDEYGSFNQKLMFEQYALGETEALDAVYFESFFGRGATCNPRAIDAEVARRRPDLPRYWSVDHSSVAVPDGAIPLVIGTREWWRIRESARWIVTNEWMRGRYVKKDHQTVLQTWHGSMYKRIGIDRGRGGQRDRARAERANWDMFISQNADTTPIIIQAYEFEAEPSAVLEIGYPRNDELFVADRSRTPELRRALGIPEGTTVVMYAPTWREPGQTVELLDLRALSKALGDGFTFLQRGHVRTLEEGEALAASGVIDVSTYPQINDLYLASDMLVTDYSSMMFDFSVTGRPMVFYTPDIDEYTDPKVRGAYFDLEELAPGPVVRTPDEVSDLLREFVAWPQSFTDRYGAWTRRFNHRDDGHASERAVDALFSFDPAKRTHTRRRGLFNPSAGEDA